MDPIVIVPVALALAWAASRKRKSTKKKTVTDPEPEPEVVEPPVWDGPGFDPWRPGGPEVPKPPQDGPTGPKPWPGPSGGPKSPEEEDPRPTEIYPGTTATQIEEHEYAGYGLFISLDCNSVFEGERWYEDVFLPRARELVLDTPEAYHHPVGVIYALLVADQMRGEEPETPVQECVAAWPDFVYGDVTPLGTFSGWVTERSDPADEYWDYLEWFANEYYALDRFLNDLYSRLYAEAELAEVFEEEWPDDDPDAGDIEFDPEAA